MAQTTNQFSYDEELLPEGIAGAAATAKERAAARRPSRQPELLFMPPIEFAALVGLCIAVTLSGLSSVFLCKPVMLSHCLVRGKHRVMKQCHSCTAPPAAQAQHRVYLQQQGRVLQPLPLPLRQYLGEF